MTTRQEKRAYRVSLVRNLEDLETIHCRVCTIREENSQLSAEKTCGLCPIYKEIRTIGNLLSPNNAPSKETKKRTRTNNVMEVIDYKMTPDQYKAYKASRMTDIAIAKSLGVSIDSLQLWKRERKLVGIKLNHQKRGVK